jgi:DNA-binding GntR family transcriptional regulator
MSSLPDVLRIDQRPKTLKEMALERVRNAVIEGAFEPGQRLVERQLCERLGVSRSVVREVIRHLESEGLVETLPNRGPRVCRLDRETAQEIYQIRALLEPAAAAACARLASPGTVDMLEAALTQLNRAHETRDSLAALAATTRFYEIIFTTGAKHVAWEMVQRLNGRISRLRAMTLASEGRHAAGIKRLRQIQTAIGQHDPERAAEACRRHVAEAAEIAAGLIVD